MATSYIAVGVCPFCDGGVNTACFVTYEDGGYFCHSCRACKSSSAHSDFIITKPSLNYALPENIEWNPKKFSISSLKWLMQYYLQYNDIRKFKLGYLEEYKHMKDCIVFIDKDFYVIRSIAKKEFRIIGDKSLPQIFGKKSKTIVICEDYLSAIRCSQITNSIALWGTSASNRTLQHIVANYNSFIVWLDGDKPGLAAAKILIEKLEREIRQYLKKHPFLNLEYRINQIITDKDPKAYSSIEIQSKIEEIECTKR